jgi:hypothetical protein
VYQYNVTSKPSSFCTPYVTCHTMITCLFDEATACNKLYLPLDQYTPDMRIAKSRMAPMTSSAGGSLRVGWLGTGRQGSSWTKYGSDVFSRGGVTGPPPGLIFGSGSRRVIVRLSSMRGVGR